MSNLQDSTSADGMAAFLESHRVLNEALKSLGIRSPEFIDRRLAELPEVDPDKIQRALATIYLFNSILAENHHDNTDLWETNKLLAYTLKALRLKESEDFIDTLEHDDIVEGYDLEHRQIFRNLRFMEVCSYSLHDVLTVDWPTLFERSQIITAALLTHIDTVLKTGRTVSLKDVPPHYMKERMSPERQIFKVSFRYMSPVFSGAGKVAGYLVSSKAEIVDEAPDRHELRFI